MCFKNSHASVTCINIGLSGLMRKLLRHYTPKILLIEHLSDASDMAPDAIRYLCSSGTMTCVIPWTRTHLHDTVLDIARRRLWNNLPASLRTADSFVQFKTQMKTYLFTEDWRRLKTEAAAPCDFLFLGTRYNCSYLFTAICMDVPPV